MPIRRLLGAVMAAAILAGQGVVSTRRAPRPSLRARTDLPIPQVRFEDVAEVAGLKFGHVSGDDPTQKNYIVEATGSGVAIFDYDNDGWPDVFLVNGSKWDFAHGEIRPTSRLFHNRGVAGKPPGLSFEDVTEKAGVGRTGWGQGVCVGDYDNDGFDDLFVTYYGNNVLYHNNGDGTFADVTAQAGLPTEGVRWSTGCSFFDYDRDGRLDLAVANYIRFDRSRVPKPGEDQFCLL